MSIRNESRAYSPRHILQRWNDTISHVDKVKLYVRITLQMVALFYSIFVILSIPRLPYNLFQNCLLLALAGAFALSAVYLQYRPELSRHHRDFSNVLSMLLISLLVSIWAAGVFSHLSSIDNGNVPRNVTDWTTGKVVAYGIVVILSYAIVPFAKKRRWWILAGIILIALLPFGFDTLSLFMLASLSTFSMAATTTSLWLISIVQELDSVRKSEAALQVAEERLRFARDLHDIVSHSLTAISVKSELAAAFQRNHDPRALDEMQEVHHIAQKSMGDMRSLVHGYRSINLATEIAGAKSLLRSAHITLSVEGSVTDIPVPLHNEAAWTVREGTTNIVRHSTARSAWLRLSPGGMELTNDGASQKIGPPSGLKGLASRIESVKGSLETSSESGLFTLKVTWSSAKESAPHLEEDGHTEPRNPTLSFHKEDDDR